MQTRCIVGLLGHLELGRWITCVPRAGSLDLEPSTALGGRESRMGRAAADILISGGQGQAGNGTLWDGSRV